MRKKRGYTEFSHIGDILPDAMGKYRQEKDGGLVRIWELWEGAVGTAIAENTKPAAFKGKLLIVHVSGSAWVQQLHFLKQDIIDKVNLALGKELVGDIKFKVGAM